MKQSFGYASLAYGGTVLAAALLLWSLSSLADVDPAR